MMNGAFEFARLIRQMRALHGMIPEDSYQAWSQLLATAETSLCIHPFGIYHSQGYV